MTEQQKRISRWCSVYVGLTTWPLFKILGLWLESALAVAATMLLVLLVAYPFFFKDQPGYWSWMRNWRFVHFALFGLTLSVIMYILVKLTDTRL